MGNLRSMPFENVRSRNAIATILSYMGYRHDVIPMMQEISHSTRAFIWNADGLPGFVREVNFVDILKS